MVIWDQKITNISRCNGGRLKNEGFSLVITKVSLESFYTQYKLYIQFKIRLWLTVERDIIVIQLTIFCQIISFI